MDEGEVIEMESINLGGLYLNVKAHGVDEALEKLDRLTALLKEANSLKNELAKVEIVVNYSPLNQEPVQVDV